MRNNDQLKDSLKPRLLEFASRHLKKAHCSIGANKYACPFCGSGTGKHGTSAFSIKGITYSCAKDSCGETGDIFSLAAKIYGIDVKMDFQEILKRVSDDLGAHTNENVDYHAIYSSNTSITPETPAASKKDYTEHISSCILSLQNNTSAKQYLYDRGLTDETITRFRLGYDEACYFPSAKKTLPAIVIPYNITNSYYSCRAIEDKYFYKPPNNEAGSEPIFNSCALNESNTVFVVEGAFDALSIEQLGYSAVATCGSGKDHLVQYVSKLSTKPTLILIPDNDTAGEEASKRLVQDLKGYNISLIVEPMTEQLKCKDVNEALVRDNESLLHALKQADLLKDLKIQSPDNDAVYISYHFENDLEKFKQHRTIKTGFSELDKHMGGGVFQGLYVLGAATSVGKTTFCHQIACEIAHSGSHVLFFSLEMSKFEMVSRGVSRTIGRKERIKSSVPSSLKIRQGYTDKIVISAASEFAEYVGCYMNDVQCEFGFSVEDIKAYTESFIARNNKTPVVFIDYLQILSLSKKKNSSKREEIDDIVTFLKRFSNEYKLPVFLISAINRGNYALPVSLESFKESGGIEYTADAVLGMQLSCFSTDRVFENEKKIGEKRKIIQESLNTTPREVEVLILKNRFEKSGGRIQYKYYSNCDLFEEQPKNQKLEGFVC